MRINSQPFVSFVLDLSLSLFSLPHTLGHLEHSWNTLALEKGKEWKEKKSNEINDHVRKRLDQETTMRILEGNKFQV